MGKIIIDTDIGTDVDDALAISYAVKSGLDLALVTTTHGNTHLRAQIAKKLTALLDCDVPIAAGEKSPLRGGQIFWSGIEEKALQKGESYSVCTNGVEILAQTIYENKGNVSLLALAPLTTIAKAFEQHSDLLQYISHLYLMGNALLCKDNFHLNYRAHNFRVDPYAVDVVFATDVPKTIVTTEVCKQNYFTKEDFALLKSTGDPLLNYLADSAQRWLGYSMYDIAYLYDPLVVHHLIEYDCTEKKEFGKVKITVNSEMKIDFKGILLKKLLEE